MRPAALPALPHAGRLCAPLSRVVVRTHHRGAPMALPMTAIPPTAIVRA